MHRLELINKLIKRNNYTKYLEIGVSDGYVFDRVDLDITNKIGVDPECEIYKIHWNGKGDVRCMTSDDFFNGIDPDLKFDIIFIDGLHLAEQVFRDILNSLLHLNENGIIVVHDCSPPGEENASPVNNYGIWNGTVYKGYIEAVKTFDLDFNTLYTDYGCGLIKYKNIDISAKRVEIDGSWDYFDRNRRSLLRLIDTDEFNELYLK